MKWLFIALPIVLLIFIIGCNEMSSNIIISEEIKESFEACMRLKRNAPYFNLNCHRLIEKIPKPETVDNHEANKKGVKTLSTYESNTIKVNKIEEIKLKKFIRRLSNENKIRRK